MSLLLVFIGGMAAGYLLSSLNYRRKKEGNESGGAWNVPSYIQFERDEKGRIIGFHYMPYGGVENE